ncbi:MAG: mannose-6-phosphate isomerase, class I [Deltaproteobacteria bacterium]|nr:mannose-6-phosphate isomerase, class I [Deltaproteobacteria bacterium]
MLKLDCPIILQPTAQKYHWGKKGRKSLVANLLGDFVESDPYAELWVGEHPRSPSTAIVDEAYSQRTIRLSLRELISRYPKAILGERVLGRFGPDLPFLFKVLSIEKPLSIQAHPDREHARLLFKRDSSLYPDANHKPELAIALNPVDFLYGFKDGPSLRQTFAETPELRQLVGDELAGKLAGESGAYTSAELLQQIYAAVIKAEKTRYSELAGALIKRIGDKASPAPVENLISLIAQDYGPEDLGIFSALLLNYCSLLPGQAVFVHPNVLHAYLSGELAECMANSDNVVRAGITPKKQDTETLLEMLNFEKQGPPLLVEPAAGARFPEVASYITTAEEFSCDSLAGSKVDLHLATNASPTLIFCLEGKAEIEAGKVGRKITPGQALMIPAMLSDFRVGVAGGRVLMVTVP